MHRTAYTTNAELVKGSLVEVIAFENIEEPNYHPSIGDDIDVSLFENGSLKGVVVSVFGNDLQVEISGHVSNWVFIEFKSLLNVKGAMHIYKVIN